MLIENMPNADYHAHPAISKSGLDLIMRSPAHYAYREQREASRTLVIGSATHAAILEPAMFAEKYMLLKDVPDRRSSAYKEAVKIYGEEFVLVSHEADRVVAMQESVKRNNVARRLLEEAGRAELSIFTKDPITGVEVKIRPDWICSRMVDLKTCRDARDFKFSRSINEYNYHVQHAFYSDVWFWAFGERLPFSFLALESDMPHNCKVYNLDDIAVEQGRRMYRQALNKYAECLSSGDWHGYEEEESYITLPSYAIDLEIESEEVEL